MDWMEPKRRVLTWIVIALILACALLFLLIRLALSSEDWGPSDTFTVFISIAIAGIQVLLVYALVDPAIERARQKESDQEWTSAVREFLAGSAAGAGLSHRKGRARERKDRAPQRDRTGVARHPRTCALVRDDVAPLLKRLFRSGTCTAFPDIGRPPELRHEREIGDKAN